MGCANSVDVCSSGEIKVQLDHVGQEPKMVKIMKTLEESMIIGIFFPENSGRKEDE